MNEPATASPAPRRHTQGLLALLGVVAVLLTGVLEGYWYRLARDEAQTALAYSAQRYATAIHERLRTHVERLRLVGEGVVLPRWVAGEFPSVDPVLERLLHEIVASNPALAAMNLIDRSGTNLLWTTAQPPPRKTLFTPENFRPMLTDEGHEWLLTPPRFAPGFGGQVVVGVRYPVRDLSGEVLFYAGSPYPAAALFAPPDGTPPGTTLRVIDRRFVRVVAEVTEKETTIVPDETPAPLAPHSAEQLPHTECAGPYCVTAAWTTPWHARYFADPVVRWRWGVEGGLLLTFLIALWRLRVALTQLAEGRAALATALARQETLAHADPLTRLPNRLALEEEAPRLLAAASRHGVWVAAGMLDLDDFKPINDQFGHEAGDVVLKALAARLRQVVRTSDLVARLGGDEFVLLLDQLNPSEAYTQLAAFGERLRQILSEPIPLPDGQSITVGYRIGWALYPEHGSDLDAVLRRADAELLRLKSEKGQTADVMRVAGSTIDLPATPSPLPLTQLDPFGDAASQLLAAYHTPLLDAAEVFLPRYFAACQTDPQLAPLLEALVPSEAADYRKRVFEHLQTMIAPTTTAAALAESAQRLGMQHALSGLSASKIGAAYGQWDQFLQTALVAAGLRSDTIFRLLYLLRDRATFAEQHQHLAFEAIEQTYLRFPLAHLPPSHLLEREWEEQLVEALAQLPGLLFAALTEPDLAGCFTLLSASGDAEAIRLLTQVAFHPDRAPRTNPHDPRGQGLVAQAWLRHEIVVSHDYQHDPNTAPWHEEARKVGMHTMAAIPLTTCRGTSQVLFLGGKTPFLFASPFGHHFLIALKAQIDAQRPAGDLLPNPLTGLPIPGDRAAAIRAAVATGQVSIAVQPVVDLRSGALLKVEALARLRLGDELLSPATFLPALRADELHALFRHVLKEGLAWLARWSQAFPTLQLAINLDPPTLAHPELTHWVRAALTRYAVAPERLMLELLESAPTSVTQHREALAALRYLGVRLAFDDVGSGYSGLQRLAELPFDTLKLDQTLVRQLPANPIPLLAVIRALARLAEGLERQTVAEGLEEYALIEAVSVLGVCFGQGYGIAKPMPPEALTAWAERWEAAPWRCYPASPLATPLGALAYQWQANREQGFAQLPPFTACPLSDYLLTHYPTATEIHQLHARLHASAADGDEAAWQHASKALTRWLLQEALAAYLPAT